MTIQLQTGLYLQLVAKYLEDSCMPQEALTGSRSRWRMQALRNHCPWLLGRRGQKEIMQSTSLRPDWEREYTSWKFRQFPVICKKSTDHFTPGTSFTHTVFGPFRWNEGICVVSGFCDNSLVRRLAQVCQVPLPSRPVSGDLASNSPTWKPQS